MFLVESEVALADLFLPAPRPVNAASGCAGQNPHALLSPVLLLVFLFHLDIDRKHVGVCLSRSGAGHVISLPWFNNFNSPSVAGSFPVCAWGDVYVVDDYCPRVRWRYLPCVLFRRRHTRDFIGRAFLARSPLQLLMLYTPPALTPLPLPLAFFSCAINGLAWRPPVTELCIRCVFLVGLGS